MADHRLVDDDQIVTADLLHQPKHLAFFPGLGVGVHQTRGREDTDFVPASVGFTSQRDGQMRFTHARFLWHDGPAR